MAPSTHERFFDRSPTYTSSNEEIARLFGQEDDRLLVEQEYFDDRSRERQDARVILQRLIDLAHKGMPEAHAETLRIAKEITLTEIQIARVFERALGGTERARDTLCVLDDLRRV